MTSTGTEPRDGWSEERTIVVGSVAFAAWFSYSEVLAWGADSLPLFLRSLLIWTANTIICLPVFRLIRRYPIARPHRIKRALLYVVLGVPVELVHHLLAVRTADVYVLGLPPPSLTYMLLSAVTVDQITYWSSVIVMHVLLFRRRAQESTMRVARLEAELAESRLLDLKARLQPEFLLAALRTIGTVVHGRAGAARRLLARLGDFLRVTQKHLDERQVRVEDELLLLEAALELKQAALGSRLRHQIDVSAAARRRAVAHPQLQPVVQRILADAAARPDCTVELRVHESGDASALLLTATLDGRPVASADLPFQDEPRETGDARLDDGEPALVDPDDGDRETEVLAPSRWAEWARGYETRLGWLSLLGFWAALTAWMAGSAYVLFGDDLSVANISSLLIDKIVWGVIGLPVVYLVALRYPLNIWRTPAYLALGIPLSVLSRSSSWALQPRSEGLATWVLDPGGLWTFCTLVALAHLVLYARRHEEGRLRVAAVRSQIAEARLQALEMQLRPHFLLNALHSVAALLGREPEAARQMLARIEDFLRLTLEGPGNATVPLREEVSFLEHYLEIQRVRFQDRLKTEFEVDPSAAAGLVPSLILQPIVENAIRHGIAPLATGGRITIRGTRRGQRLELCVEDDGVGAPKPLDEARFGLGLSNTKARLLLLYGKDHRFVVQSGRPGRFAVTLEIPFRTTLPAPPRPA